MIKYVWEITNYFRRVIDEADQTFISDADCASFLSIAYDEFRFFVTDIDPQRFHKVVTTPTITLNEFDLTTAAAPFVAIMGPTALDIDRMQQILRVTTLLPGTQPVGTIYTPVYSYENLINNYNYWTPRYILQGTKLMFAAPPSVAMRIEYIPQSNVNWANLSVIVPEWVDDFVQFHDIIALMAAKNYAIADGASSAQVQQQLDTRLGQLREFLSRGILVPANRIVGDDALV